MTRHAVSSDGFSADGCSTPPGALRTFRTAGQPGMVIPQVSGNGPCFAEDMPGGRYGLARYDDISLVNPRRTARSRLIIRGGDTARW